MRSKRIWRLLVVVAAVMLLGSACGDDDDAEDVANDILSDFDEEFTDLSDLTDVDEAFSEFSDFSDFSDFGGVTDVCGEVDSGDGIEVGDNVDGEIEEPGDVVAFELSGGGDTVEIAADTAGDSGFDPVLTVCDSDGNEVARDDDGGGYPNSLISDFDAEDGEDFLVVVSGFTASTGEFELSIS